MLIFSITILLLFRYCLIRTSQHGVSFCGSPDPPVHSSSFSSSSSPSSCSLPLYLATPSPAARPSLDYPSAVKAASPAPSGMRDSLECKYSSPQSERENQNGDRRMRQHGDDFRCSLRSLDQDLDWLWNRKVRKIYARKRS